MITCNSAFQLKEEGNKHFQAGEIDKAIECYTKAIKSCKDKTALAVIYRNRSACFLKKENYNNAVSDASKAIDVDAADIKALYRRCQALEKLGKLDMAFKDVQRCATIEPKNKTFLETLRRLGAEIQQKLKTTFSTDSRVQNMFDILFSDESDKEKQEKAANNLIVLAREDAGAERIFQNNGMPLLVQLIDTGKPEMILAAIRTLSGMCTGHRARATAIIHTVGISKLCSVMAVDNEEIVLATANLLQCVYDSLSGGDKRNYGKEEALVLGLKKILKVCGQVPDLPDQLPLTENTQLIASVLLNKIYDDLRCDPERDNFRDICDEYIKSKFDPNDMDKNIHAINTLSGLLQGPFDVGNVLAGRQGVMEMMVALCGSEREVDQLVAVEALIHASTKTSKASFFISNGVTLLKDMYKKTKNEKIKIRALVGLCKLGSAGGDDYSMRQFAEGSTEKLAKQCRKWLCNPTLDVRTRKWAVEGLAYLTNDADVKDDFVDDEAAMRAMFELAKSKDKTILYAVACTLVNCTNSYDKKEIIPEMVQLAKFSKQHVPEQHPKDKKDFIERRVKKLLKAGVTSALTVMVKADSSVLTDQTKEMLARVFLALADDIKDRGTIVAQGGGKALIPLALEGTDKGKIKASHALAKIAAVSNPEMAFPGERIYEVVRPLVSLLNTERDGLENFEALLGLTNLAALNDKLRVKILKEKALPEIENYMFEEHDQIRQAATECMCNLVCCKEVQDRYLEDGNDKLKLLVLLCGEDDVQLQRAAAGALAMLTAAQKKLAVKITKVTGQWLEIIQRLCIHDNPEIQHRGLVTVFNMLDADEQLAKKLIESELLEILTFVAKLEDNPKKQDAINAARTCLSRAMDTGLIKPFSN
uniref:Protein unc-45 homolog B n=1 Tax=Cyprinus carpio carpio TaxID=630221 RepID=A0A9J7X406_CYPCA